MNRKEYIKQYQKEWIRNRRQKFFKDKCCSKCGSEQKLELDHINPLLKVSHNIWSWKEERRELELTKCQILCYNCHLEKTILQTLSKSITHGNSGYDRKCRCDICKTAHSERMLLRKR